MEQRDTSTQAQEATMTTTLSADQIDDAIDHIEFHPNINMEIVVKHMDNEIREGLHAEMHEAQQFTTEIGFLRAYIKAHFDKHSEIFHIN